MTSTTNTPSYEKWAYLIAAALLGLLAVNTLVFGLAGLAMTALVLVPVVFIVLLIITVGG
ncbi:hypothetical protein [Pelagimonas varians]|uniref:Uncharacterized protein n=1 Tax=Pelagimonas varians TaxID=696760 RepID=A0A238KCB8_9RHOB|nr:hypothetical protein [Pelagimonas varians]PYG30011.1 hypothetical protein C8N36_107178 [Pelagimonas varians]SMX40488.1 hypothetical protein PEV8663_02018 [Pelagimonas varians]